MLRSHIHLIGGGPGTLGSMRQHLRDLLPRCYAPAAKKPSVAYVGAASGDDAGFRDMIGAEISRAGARIVAVKLASRRAKLSTAEAVLGSSDVIFVSGGDVDLGMKVLQDRGAVSIFEKLAREGRPFVGISAGSIMLGRAWVRFPEQDESPKHKRTPKALPTIFPCLGLAPVYVDAHAEEDRWAELRALLGLLAARGEGAVGYGLTRKGGISLEPTGRGVRVVPFGTSTPKLAAFGGKVVKAASLRLGSSEVVATPRKR
jgi:peptidase E